MNARQSKLVEVVAQALWEESRKSEITRASSFTLEKKVFASAAGEMRDAPKRLAIVIGWALVSKVIGSALKFHLSHGTPSEQNDFLEGLGPLASDSARIRLIRLLGWLPDDTMGVLNYMRRVRNTVAHSIVSDAGVGYPDGMPSAGRKVLDAALDAIAGIANEGGEKFNFSIEARARAYFLLIAFDVMQLIVCGPGRLRLGMQSNDRRMFFSYDEGPEWSRNARCDVAEGLLALGGNVKTDDIIS